MKEVEQLNQENAAKDLKLKLAQTKLEEEVASHKVIQLHATRFFWDSTSAL